MTCYVYGCAPYVTCERNISADFANEWWTLNGHWMDIAYICHFHLTILNDAHFAIMYKVV